MSSPARGSIRTQCAVAFEKSSGTILHVHFFHASPGTKPRAEAEIRGAAARGTALPAGEVGVIIVKPGALRQDRRYRVDPAAGKLVTVKAAAGGFTARSGLTLAPGRSKG